MRRRLRPGRRGRAGASRFHDVRRVVSNLGVFDFETPERTMRLRSFHPGVSVEEVVAATGFELAVPDDVAETRLPTPEELELLRRCSTRGLRGPRGEELSGPPDPASCTRRCAPGSASASGCATPSSRPAWAGWPGPRLVAATCEAGGLGILASATMTLDQLATAIGEVRGRTDRPFGVNLRTDVADVDERIEP